MKKRVVGILVSIFLVLVLVAAGCAGQKAGPAPTVTVTTTATVTATTGATATTPASTQSFTFTLAWNDIWGPISQASRVYMPGGWLQRMLYERSNRRLQLKIVPRMFDAMDMLRAVAQGQADMADIPTPWYSGTYPLWNWEDIPGIYSLDAIQGYQEGNAVYSDPKFLEIYDKSFREAGVIFWFPTQWGPSGSLWSTKPITKLADMKGLKFRVHSTLAGEGIKRMGGSPISIAASEVPAAIKSGVADGSTLSLFYGYQIGMADVAKNFVYSPLAPGWTASTIMNAKKFDALPADLKKILMEVGQEVGRMDAVALTGEQSMGEEVAKLAGVKISNFEPAEQKTIQELIKPLEDEWLKTAGPLGPQLLSAIHDAVAKFRAFQQPK